MAQVRAWTNVAGIVDGGRVGQGERSDASPLGHLMFAHLPVHCFDGSPRHCHLFRHSGPHISTESRLESKSVTEFWSLRVQGFNGSRRGQVRLG